MQIIQTHTMDPDALEPWERDQVYNGLDVCVTHDVFRGLRAQLDEVNQRTYEFSKCLQGPVLDMNCRGVMVDIERRDQLLDEFCDLIDSLEWHLEQIVLYGVGLANFNWRSHADLRRLFYEELKLEPVYRAGKVTTDESAREMLQWYPIAEQIIKHINAISILGKKISVLKTSIDRDGRFRTSYNIAGTRTGRFSSSESVFDTGGNLQNIEEALREIFIPNPGHKFAKADARSGESFCVGALQWNLFGDGRYLDACETGDVHTSVARVCWPKLPWTGDIKLDEQIAKAPYYRHHTYRFMCKKIGHGTHYGGHEATLAMQSHMPISIVAQFQLLYHEKFPALRLWHDWVKDQLRKHRTLTSLTGRRRQFLGRPSDPKILREALAYDPQGSLADIVNMGMLRIWREDIAKVVMTDHDAITVMYPEANETQVINALNEALIVPLRLANGRELRIPYDIEVGWNKGEMSDANPWGLGPWPDQRRGPKPQRKSDWLESKVDRIGIFDRPGPIHPPKATR